LLAIHDEKRYGLSGCFLDLTVEARGVFEIVRYLEEFGWEKVES
jgi:hypothetical protein